MSEPFEPARPFGTSVDTPATVSAFLPILVLGLVMLGWFGFQAMQLRTEREAMRTAFAAQDKPMGDAKKLRDSLEAIAKGTAQLADAGNPSARLMVDELNRRGITISQKPPAPPAEPAAAPVVK